MSGRNHSEETRKKISAILKGVPLSEQHKNAIGAAMNFSFRQAKKIIQCLENLDPKELVKPPLLRSAALRRLQKIEVFDKDNNETTTYDSISAAAIALNIRQTSISEYLRNNRTNLFKNRYVFKKVVS